MTAETPTTLLPVLDASTGRPVSAPARPVRMEPYYLGRFTVAGHAVAVYRNGSSGLWLEVSIDQSAPWQVLGAVVWHVVRGIELHMHPIRRGSRLVIEPESPAAEELLFRAVEIARSA